MFDSLLLASCTTIYMCTECCQVKIAGTPIRGPRGGGRIWPMVFNFCCCSLLPFALEPGGELAHANLLPAPSPPQFPRELKAQRAAWIHSKDCEPLNSLSAQLQQASFKQSSAAVGMENLAVNSAKSSYLSPSERHQLRKESSFKDVLSVLQYISHVSVPPLLTLYPSLGSEGQWMCRKERSVHLHCGRNPDSPGNTSCHWANQLALKVPHCICCILHSTQVDAASQDNHPHALTWYGHLQVLWRVIGI